MWKSHDYPVDAAVEAGSLRPESPSEPNDTHSQNLQPPGPQRALAEGLRKPSLPADIAAYTAAVNDFSKNATAFIDQLPLLTKARDSYDRAMKISTEVHNVLDTGEEELRTIMTTLAQVLEDHVVRVEKKKPEAAKPETATVTHEAAEALNR